MMLYGPDNKPILDESNMGISMALIRGFDLGVYTAAEVEARRRIYTQIFAPNGNYARYEVEQEEIRELERLL